MSDRPLFVASRVGRRAFLGGAGLVTATVLAGCTPDVVGGHTTPPKPDPDVLLAAAVLETERSALLLVQAVVARFPALAGALASTAAGHTDHVRLLTAVLPAPSASASASASAPASASTSASTSAPTSVPASATPVVPATRRLARRAVSRREARLVVSHREAALAARAGRLARIVASMGAAAAQQAAALGAT